MVPTETKTPIEIGLGLPGEVIHNGSYFAEAVPEKWGVTVYPVGGKFVVYFFPRGLEHTKNLFEGYPALTRDYIQAVLTSAHHQSNTNHIFSGITDLLVAACIIHDFIERHSKGEIE